MLGERHMHGSLYGGQKRTYPHITRPSWINLILKEVGVFPQYSLSKCTFQRCIQTLTIFLMGGEGFMGVGWGRLHTLVH